MSLRVRLFLLLLSVAVAGASLYEWLPQVAASTLMILVMMIYGGMMSAAMLDHKRKILAALNVGLLQHSAVTKGKILALILILAGLVAFFWHGFITGPIMLVGLLLLLAALWGLFRLLKLDHLTDEQFILPNLPEPCPWVTVVVPAHNEADVIANTVRNLLALDYPNFNVLVMDDRSTDATAQVLQELPNTLTHLQAQRFSFVTRAPQAVAGKSAVLNEAMALSTGAVLAVFDADARCEPDFLRLTVPLLYESPNIGAVQAQKMISNRHENWLAACQHAEYNLDAYFQCGRDTIQGAVELRGNGMLVRREALQAVGGWTESSITDDLDLSTKLHVAGWDIRFMHKAIVLEQGITHLSALIKQRIRWAQGSLTRYLTYAPGILFGRNTSFRAKADMITYLAEFLFPFWLLTDYGLMLLHGLMGDPLSRMRLLSSAMVLPLLSGFFIGSLWIAIYRFNRPFAQGPWQTFRFVAFLGVLTALYMPVIWLPVVFWVSVRFMLKANQRFEWAKTEHVAA